MGGGCGCTVGAVQTEVGSGESKYERFIGSVCGGLYWFQFFQAKSRYWNIWPCSDAVKRAWLGWNRLVFPIQSGIPIQSGYGAGRWLAGVSIIQ